MSCLCTSKTVNSALWFVNNPKLEERILAYLAKYQEKYGVILYAFVIQGNHYHINAKFPRCNRAAFFRDLNARIAEAVRELVPQFLGGPLMERRFTAQFLPLDFDVEKYFFYCALQSVKSGLSQKISDYPGYNSFADAARGRKRKFKLLDRAVFNCRSRNNPSLKAKDFIKEYTLSFTRLPGYEDHNAKAYSKLMHDKLEEKRQEAIAKRLAEGKGFVSPEKLREVVPGSFPKSTKKGGWRPIVLTACYETRKRIMKWYIGVVKSYRDISKRYFSGEEDACFPPGTYKPPGPFVPVI